MIFKKTCFKINAEDTKDVFKFRKKKCRKNHNTKNRHLKMWKISDQNCIHEYLWFQILLFLRLILISIKFKYIQS
jgi:hypothetical protein